MNPRFKVLLSISLLLFLASHTIFAQKPELVVQTGHTGALLQIAFSPDGKTLAVISVDLKLWDVTTGVELRTLGRNLDVLTIAFSPDGKMLASGAGSGMVDLWDVMTGLKLRSLELNKHNVYSVAFSPDGKTLAASGRENIKLWDALTGIPLRSFEEKNETIRSIAFSPDGLMLASGNSGIAYPDGDKAKLTLRDIATSRQIRSFVGQTSEINSIVFSSDGRTLACGSSDRAVNLWEVATGRQLRTFAGSANVHSIALNPDGKTFASGTRDGRFDVVELATGAHLRSFQGRNEIVGPLALAPGGKLLATAGEAVEVKNNNFDTTGGGEIHLWDLSTGTPLRSLARHVSGVEAVAFSPDGRMLAGACLDGTVKVWDLSTGVQLRSFKGYADHTAIFTLSDYSLAFSPDSQTLASASLGEAVNLWNIATGKQLRSLEGDGFSALSLSFSPDGKTLAGGGTEESGGAIILWDVPTGRPLHTLKGHSRMVTSLAFSSDGETLVSGDRDGMLKRWDVLKGQPLLVPQSFASNVTQLAISPDGKLLVSLGDDKTLTVHDVLQGRQLRALQGPAQPLRARDSLFFRKLIAFSPDNKKLVSASESTIKLWDVSTGAQLPSLEKHSTLLASVTFSPDGNTLAGGSLDGTIKLWNTNSGKELASLISIDENDWAVVAPDGLFDGSPSAWNKLIWRAPQNTFDYAPVEAYFNDFYYPGLLADISAGNAPQAPQDIAKKDRRSPHLRLTLSGQPTHKEAINARSITVKIEVFDAVAGARDVRLFRNGALVKVWRGDVLQGRSSATLDATLPITAGENRVTAYAFNRDNVKSEDGILVIRGANNLQRKGTVYVLAVGVDKYANSQYNLRYAVADARSFAAEVKSQQERIGRYERVEVRTLYDGEATKASILRALTKLSRQAKPEDSVIIYFAGHGTARANQFYIIPHDLGYVGDRSKVDGVGLSRILKNSVSDRELERAFEHVDAGHLLLVIDACNSGQALEAEEKRRGPMNSKGLAQLAYEKGMYILTASHSYQLANESPRLGHGFLTYALIDEGLKQGRADGEPSDGQILVREWLNFATERVPQIHKEQMKLGDLLTEAKLGSQANRGVPLIKLKEEDVQHPRVFYRRELEAQPLIVAKGLSTP